MSTMWTQENERIPVTMSKKSKNINRKKQMAASRNRKKQARKNRPVRSILSFKSKDGMNVCKKMSATNVLKGAAKAEALDNYLEALACSVKMIEMCSPEPEQNYTYENLTPFSDQIFCQTELLLAFDLLQQAFGFKHYAVVAEDDSLFSCWLLLFYKDGSVLEVPVNLFHNLMSGEASIEDIFYVSVNDFLEARNACDVAV